MNEHFSQLEPPILGKYLPLMAELYGAKVIDMMLAFGIGSNQQYHDYKKLTKDKVTGRVLGEEEMDLALAIHFMHFVRYPERFAARNQSAVNWSKKVRDILDLLKMGEGISAKAYLGELIGHRHNQIYNYLNPDNESKPSRYTGATLLNLEYVLTDPDEKRRARVLRKWEKDAEAVWANRSVELPNVAAATQPVELIKPPIVRQHFQELKDQFVAKDVHLFQAFGFSQPSQFAAGKEPLKHVEPTLAINFMYLVHDRALVVSNPPTIEDLCDVFGLSKNSDRDKIWIGRMVGRQRQAIYNSLDANTTPDLYLQATIAELYSVATHPEEALRKRMLKQWEADVDMIWDRTTLLKRPAAASAGRG